MVRANRVSRGKKDREIERDRYSLKATEELTSLGDLRFLENGIEGIPEIHHEPYLNYYAAIKKFINPTHTVLEIAAGTGRHTMAVLETGAQIFALDISDIALSVLEKRTQSQVTVICAPMESMPFSSNTFDFVLTCGGISYAENSELLDEIFRVLKPGGGVVFLDSLNHNPIYRLNRFIRFLRRDRTYSTLKRLPTIAFINLVSLNFEKSSFTAFGKVLWLKQLASKFGSSGDFKLILWLEKIISPRFAFKFLLVCENLKK